MLRIPGVVEDLQRWRTLRRDSVKAACTLEEDFNPSRVTGVY